LKIIKGSNKTPFSFLLSSPTGPSIYLFPSQTTQQAIGLSLPVPAQSSLNPLPHVAQQTGSLAPSPLPLFQRLTTQARRSAPSPTSSPSSALLSRAQPSFPAPLASRLFNFLLQGEVERRFTLPVQSPFSFSFCFNSNQSHPMISINPPDAMAIDGLSSSADALPPSFALNKPSLKPCTPPF
jgi:hypothetical protein